MYADRFVMLHQKSKSIKQDWQNLKNEFGNDTWATALNLTYISNEIYNGNNKNKENDGDGDEEEDMFKTKFVMQRSN